jgi:NAD(P)H-dependent FMN reductase
VSPGNFGGIRAQTDLRRLMHSIGAHVLPKPEIAIPQAKLKFDDDRQLTDDATKAMLTSLLEKFSTFIRVHQSHSAA